MSDPLINSTLGSYNLRELVSVGGIAQVYRAVNSKDKTSYAVKVMRSDKQKDSYHLSSFRDEFKLLKRLRHPQLPVAYVSGEIQGRACFVMDLIEGRPLHRVCDTGQTIDGIAVFYQLVEIVAYLHGQHLVHADLKLENVLLKKNGSISLVDFGNARRISEGWLAKLMPTMKQRVFGTPSYLAPELALGKKLTYGSDIYSLGVCAFMLISGEPPFAANSRSARLQANVGQVAPSLRSRSTKLPGGVISAIDRCLDKDPDGRHENAIVLLRAIASLAPKNLQAGQQRHH